MTINIHASPFDHLPTVLVPVEKGSSYERKTDQVAQLTGIDASVIRQNFKAEPKEDYSILYHNTEGKSHQLKLIGIGDAPTFPVIKDAMRSFVHNNSGILPTELGLAILPSLQQEESDIAEAAINGILLGRYKMGRYKTDKKQPEGFLSESAILHLFTTKDKVEKFENVANKIQHISATQMELLNLVNAPANKKNPEELARWAIASAEKYGYQATIFNKQKIEEIGLHGLLAVNRGSEFPPVFIILEYVPENTENAKKVGLVGKGVTFDTGGLSIKGSTNMHYMKSDMGGAAAVLGTMEASAKLKLPLHLVGIIPATDNSVDALSVKPSDVISSYSGKTIEIIDTDAEGRLILADGLSYMVRNYQPNVLLDLATLTGSVIRALGVEAGGLFSNNDELAADLLTSGEATGERLWRLPIWKEYGNYMNSDVADVKNLSARPIAGSITAAKFLEHFIDDHTNWAHMDIAGMALGDSEYSTGKSATAYGIRLLIDFLEKQAQKVE